MKQRILAAAALGGLALLIATTLIVLKFGRTNPSPPSLLQHPNPAIPGELLFRTENNCLTRADASGESRQEVYCGQPANVLDKGGSITWVDASTLGFLAYDPGSSAISRTLVKVDIASGQVVGEEKVTGPAEYYGQSISSPAGDTATVSDDGRLLVAKDGKQTEIADFGIEGYRIRPVLWSPDNEWIVLFYTPPRDYNDSEFWIIKRDGSVEGTIATGLQYQSISWRIDGVGITPGYQ